MENLKIDWTRINNDVNGNPRYVCHFLEFITDQESQELKGQISQKYNLAIDKAKTIGGKKFHNKQYGGGIVFQSYSLPDLEKHIFELLND